MLKMILDSTIDRVRQRASEGDCPVTPPFSVEHLETALLTLSGHLSDNAHPDDLAVDRFAAAMKAKLAQKREEGRRGWDDKEDCSAEFLSSLLRRHVEKGDPLDVGNFAMMLHQRGEGITAQPVSPSEGEAVAYLSRIKSPGPGDYSGWVITTDKDYVKGFCVRMGYEIQPLYTHPASGQSDTERLRAVLEPFAALADKFGCWSMVEVCAPDPGNPSPVIQPVPVAAFENAAAVFAALTPTPRAAAITPFIHPTFATHAPWAGPSPTPPGPVPGHRLTLPFCHADRDAIAVNLSATIDDDVPVCGICNVVLITGDRCMTDIDLGTVHAACCGPERESYVNLETGDPIGPHDPIPTPWIWNGDGTVSEGPRAPFVTAHTAAERDRRAHRQQPGDFAIEADGPRPTLHDAFETISHDGGTAAGHAVYFVPERWTEHIDRIEAALSALTPEERLAYYLDGFTREVLAKAPMSDLWAARNLLDAFRADWPEDDKPTTSGGPAHG